MSSYKYRGFLSLVRLSAEELVGKIVRDGEEDQKIEYHFPINDM